MLLMEDLYICMRDRAQIVYSRQVGYLISDYDRIECGKDGIKYMSINAELTYFSPVLKSISHIKFPSLMELSLCNV